MTNYDFREQTNLGNGCIQIGSISLQGFEIPASIRFGGRQRIAVHNLAGGRRVVERLGPDDGDIVFRGTISGPAAAARVQAFDNLRLSGATVWLTWESFRRQVIVKNFVAEYHSPWWIPYKIDCVVVHQAEANLREPLTLLAGISADLSNALSLATDPNISLLALRTSLFASNAMTNGTSTQLQAMAEVRSALNLLDSGISENSSMVSIPFDPKASFKNTGQRLASLTSSAGSLATAVNTRSYLGRIGTSLSNLGI